MDTKKTTKKTTKVTAIKSDVVKSDVVKNYIATKGLKPLYVSGKKDDTSFANLRYGKAGTSLIHVILCAILGYAYKTRQYTDILAIAVSGYSNGKNDCIKDGKNSGCLNFTTNAIKFLSGIATGSVLSAFSTQYKKLLSNPQHIADYVAFFAMQTGATNKDMVTQLRKALADKKAKDFNDHIKAIDNSLKVALSSVKIA